MRYIFAYIILLSAASVALLLGDSPSPQSVRTVTGEQEAALSGHRYPDFGFLPPENQYEGRVFRLSQDYPQIEPSSEAIPEIAIRDFNMVTAQWKQYLLDVRAYCFKGNVGAQDVEDDCVGCVAVPQPLQHRAAGWVGECRENGCVVRHNLP